MAFQAGSIFAEMELDTSPLVKGLKDASKAIDDFAKTVKDKIDKAGGKPVDSFAKRIVDLGKRFKKFATDATQSLKRVATAFRGVTKVLTSPFRLLANFLTKSIFNLKNLIIVIAAAAFIRRAKEVEAIATAFRNLSRGVGEMASEFLPALRVALRGTVSDLDIMKVTNNAILLGVVESQTQFAELAVIARRLGRAVGRDAVNALNDLAVGIGRQSRLILDNLGIVVNVEKAYKVFAARLGTTADKLSDTQKRQAFLNAVMVSARRKVETLGADVLTVADQWDRLTAAINNTINALATSLVGGQLPAAVATFLDENRKVIVDFAVVTQATITTFIGNLVKAITTAFKQGQIANLILKLLKSIILVIAQGIIELLVVVIPIFASAVADLFEAAFEGPLDVIANTGTRFNVASRLARALGGGDDDVAKAGDRLKRQFRLLGPALEVGFGNLADTIRAEQKKIGDLLGVTFEGLDVLAPSGLSIGEALNEVFLPGRGAPFLKLPFEDLLGDTKIFIENFKTLLKDGFDTIGVVNVPALKDFLARDTLSEFQPLLVTSVLQPLATAINLAEQFSRELAIRKPDLFPADQVQAVRGAIELFAGLVTQTNKVVVAFNKLTTPEILDPTIISQRIKPFEEALRKVNLQLSQLGKSVEEQARLEFQSLFGNALLADNLKADKAERSRLQTIIEGAKQGKINLDFATRTGDLLDRAKAATVELLSLDKSRSEAALIRVGALEDITEEQRKSRFEAELAVAEAEDLLENARELIDARMELVESTVGIIGQGVTEGILRGKIAFQDVAEVGANLFRRFMDKAINDIAKSLDKALTSVLGSTGAVGLAGALIGIGGLIISNLQGKTESSIDDFGDQVSSSEAVRGVVAGPTNVAISKVGNQLKEALRVSEGLLLRIANAVESGGGGGGGGAGDTGDNLSVLLSGSTPS